MGNDLPETTISCRNRNAFDRHTWGGGLSRLCLRRRSIGPSLPMPSMSRAASCPGPGGSSLPAVACRRGGFRSSGGRRGAAFRWAFLPVPFVLGLAFLLCLPARAVPQTDLRSAEFMAAASGGFGGLYNLDFDAAGAAFAVL